MFDETFRKAQGSWEALAEKIQRCETDDEFVEVMASHINDFSEWNSYIRPLYIKNELSHKLVSQACRTSERTAKRIFSKIPTKRSYVICLAILFGFDIEETNDLLVNYAKYSKLYSKNIEDLIWMYIIKQSCGEIENSYIENLLFHNGNMQPMIAFIEMKNDFIDLENNINSCNVQPKEVNTDHFEITVFDVPNDKKEILEKLEKCVPEFRDANSKLIKFINESIENKSKQHIDNLESDDYQDDTSIKKISANSMYSTDNGAKQVFYRSMTKLEQFDAIDRDFLIDLCLRLSFDTEDTNRMLKLAKMAPLCSNGIADCIVYYLLEKLMYNYPTTIFASPYNNTNYHKLADINNDIPSKDKKDYCHKYVIENKDILMKKIYARIS